MYKVKKVLWSKDVYNNLLIDAEDIEEYLEFSDYVVSIKGVDVKLINFENLDKEYNEYEKVGDLEEDLINFFNYKGYQNIEIDYIYGDTYTEPFQLLAFDYGLNNFFNVANCGKGKMYKFWNGSDYGIVTNFPGEYEIETTLTLHEDYVNLDGWDRNNNTIGVAGKHQRIYKILELDGEVVEGEYLLEYWSNWVGTHSSAEILGDWSVKKHLSELGRDIDEYMRYIGNIGRG